MNRNEKYQIVFYRINLIVLFLFFLQFFGFPNKLTLIWSLIFCVVFTVLWKKPVLHYSDALLFSAMILYAWISKGDFNTLVSVAMLPLLFSIVGKGMAYSALYCGKGKQEIETMLLILISGYFLHGFLNSLIYFWKSEMFITRYWADIWTGAILPATQQNIYVLPILALLIPELLYHKKSAKKCIGTVIAVLYVLVFSFLSASRLPIMVFVVVAGWELALYFFMDRSDGQVVRILKYSLLVVLAIVAVAVLVWSMNLGDIRHSSVVSMMSRDGGILGNIRFQAQISAIQQLFKYPFGGYQMELAGLSFAHNVWLDIANAAGIIPFFLFLGYTLISIWDLIVLLRNGIIDQLHKSLLSGLYLVFILYYMVEPALEANVQYLLPWIFLNGIIHVYGKTGVAQEG